MTTNITQSLRPHGPNLSLNETWETRAPLPTSRIPDGSHYEHGVRFHALLRRIADARRLTATERTYLPYLEAVRNELRAHGVSFITPEFPLEGDAEFSPGRCDMLFRGGLTDVGVGEIKCVASIPQQAHPDHVQQLSRYAEMISRKSGDISVWGCICYVCVITRTVRFFVFRNATGRVPNAPEEVAA